MATTTTSSALLDLPDDLLLRVLIGVPRADHGATAATCRAFRAVISGPRFLRLRREWGFAERGIVLVETERWAFNLSDSPRIVGIGTELHGLLKIRTAHDGRVANVPIGTEIGFVKLGPSHGRESEATTDGGARLFLSCGDGDPLTDNEVVMLDASRRRWKHFATLPASNQGGHCMEWHGGCLYVAGGESPGHHDDCLNSLHAFHEETGLWEELPPMPHGCMCASSGVIGDQLFIVGGFILGDNQFGNHTNILQIYDISTRTWRLGARHPEVPSGGWRIFVADGRLFIESHAFFYNYDPQSDTWTDLGRPFFRGEFDETFVYSHFCECVHNGRIVFFYRDGVAWERANDGSWSRYEAVEPEAFRNLNGPLGAFGSVLLG